MSNNEDPPARPLHLKLDSFPFHMNVERSLGQMNTIEKVNAYLVFDKTIREMKLVMDVETNFDSFVNTLRTYAGESAG